MKLTMWLTLVALAACSEEPAAPGPADALRQIVKLAKDGKTDQVWPLLSAETRRNAERDGNKEMMLDMVGKMLADITPGTETVQGESATVAIKTGFGDGTADMVREEGAWRLKKVNVSMTIKQ